MPPAPSTWSLKDFSRLATGTSSQYPSVMTVVVDIRRPQILRSLLFKMRDQIKKYELILQKPENRTNTLKMA